MPAGTVVPCGAVFEAQLPGLRPAMVTNVPRSMRVRRQVDAPGPFLTWNVRLIESFAHWLPPQPPSVVVTAYGPYVCAGAAAPGAAATNASGASAATPRVMNRFMGCPSLVRPSFSERCPHRPGSCPFLGLQ